MAQDNQEQYGQGYGGYTGSSQDPNDPYGSQQQQQYGSYQSGGGYQQQQQQQQYVPPSSYTQQQQQYSSYQAPSSAAIGASAYDPTSVGLSARTEALLSYIFVWLGGLVFFIIERKNRFVRFAAAQSFLFFVPALIVYGILKFLAGFLGGLPLIGLLFGPLFGIISTVFGILLFLIWVYLIIQTLRGKIVRLPFFSTYAESLVNRTTRRPSV